MGYSGVADGREECGRKIHGGRWENGGSWEKMGDSGVG